MREIRDNKHYRTLGLTWEEFCSRHTGVDRRTADRIVERLEEFGEAYFNLSQLMPIPTSSYRELDGRKIPIAESKTQLPFSALRNRLDLCHSELAGAIRRAASAKSRAPS